MTQKKEGPKTTNQASQEEKKPDLSNVPDNMLELMKKMTAPIKTESIDKLVTFLTSKLSVQEKTEFIEEIQDDIKYIEKVFESDEVCQRFDDWIDSELERTPINTVQIIHCKADLPIAHTYERFPVLISTAVTSWACDNLPGYSSREELFEFSYNSALSSMRNQLREILVDVICDFRYERFPSPLRFKMQAYYRY